MVKMLFEYQPLMTALPTCMALSKEDIILSLLYRLKSGCPFYVLVDIFGSSESTLSRVFNTALDIMVQILNPVINLPTP